MFRSRINNKYTLVFEATKCFKIIFNVITDTMNVIFFGAGIGSIILTVAWIFALFCCFISLRTKYNLGPLVVTAVIILTILLLSIPKNTEQPQSVESSSKVTH